MSYSFSASGATKAEAKEAVAAAFDRVIETQPVHASDKAAALANAGAVIDLLADPVPDGMVVSVSCNGYVSWTGALRDDGSTPIHSASVSASAYYVTAPALAAG